MPILPIDLGNQSNPGRDFRDGSGRLINCYVEPRGKEGRHPTPVYPVDGLSLFSDLPIVNPIIEPEGDLLIQDGEQLLLQDGDNFILEGNQGLALTNDPDNGVQVLIQDRGFLWAVTGSYVYKVDSGGNATLIGPIARSSIVTADVNRESQIGIVSGGNYYVLDTSLETLTDYTNLLFYAGANNDWQSGANSVCHYNGYMVVTYPGNRWQISTLNDATGWADADTETAIFRGDKTLRCLARGGDLLIFGSKSLEFWQDVGATNDFAFSRVAAIEVGIGPPLSAVNLDETVLFVDENGAVRLLRGYQTEVVSTHYIARKIRQASDIESIRGTAYERDGHLFYSISCNDFTLTYNLATGLWHEEKSYGLNRRLINAVTRWSNKWYAGDFREGAIYELSNETYDDGTEKPIVMEVITPPVHSFPDRVRVRSLYIDALVGTALASDSASDESDPKLLVWVSENDGEDWIFLETLSLGDINSTYEELRIQGVGTSDQNGFVFKLQSSTPVMRGIMGMSADITKVRA